jgi:hypothetical protein
MIDVAGGAEHWRRVLDENSLAIYVPPPYDPSLLKLEVYGIPPKT